MMRFYLSGVPTSGEELAVNEPAALLPGTNFIVTTSCDEFDWVPLPLCKAGEGGTVVKLSPV